MSGCEAPLGPEGRLRREGRAGPAGRLLPQRDRQNHQDLGPFPDQLVQRNLIRSGQQSGLFPSDRGHRALVVATAVPGVDIALLISEFPNCYRSERRHYCHHP